MLNDCLDLFTGVRDRHLVHKKLKLNQHPVVLGGVVNAVVDRNNPHARVAQGLQLQQTKAIPPGKTGKVLDYQDL